MIALDIELFRTNFPRYSDDAKYTDMMLEAQYEIGKCFIEDSDLVLSEKCREYALQLMLAHLLYLDDLELAGGNSSVVASASIDSVSTSFAVPDVSDGWDNWMNLSPFGKKLYALISSKAFGFYVGGSPERSSYRKAGGRF